MIKIMRDGKTVLAEVRLVDGKLDVKKIDKDYPIEDTIEFLDDLHGYKLTDEEVYRMMPHRLNSRVSAEPEGDDAEKLMDPSFYDEVTKRLGDKMMGRKPADAKETPAPAKGLLGAEKENLNDPPAWDS